MRPLAQFSLCVAVLISGVLAATPTALRSRCASGPIAPASPN